MARKKKEEAPPAGAPEWMVTYSDLVTLLMCFFVLLYSMATGVDTGKLEAISSSFAGGSALNSGASDGLLELWGNGIIDMPASSLKPEDIEEVSFEDKSEEMKEMYSDFKTYFVENKIDDTVNVSQDENFLQVTFEDGILFDKGSDSIREDVLPVLSSIGNLLKTKYPDSHLEIVGHTDNDPINVPRFPDNWFLSSARAINVSKYFIDEKQFSPKEISAIGRGEFDPIVPNDTEVNKSKNRRVEMRIYSSFDED